MKGMIVKVAVGVVVIGLIIGYIMYKNKASTSEELGPRADTYNGFAIPADSK